MRDLPDGWQRAVLGDVSKFLTGFPFSSSQFAPSGVKLIRGSNVKRGELDWSPDISRYWRQRERSLQTFELTAGDIVIAMDGALVGRSYARIENRDLPAYLVQRVARLRSVLIDQDLLCAWIGSHAFITHVDSVKTHTAIPHISPRDIREFVITVPVSRAEQQKIARALKDIDDLIVRLERLIAKKQGIQQGMMQQLLTGEARLPSFAGSWRPQRFSELLAYEQPGRYMVATSAHLKSGLYPVLTAGKTFILGYTNETKGVYRGRPAIIFDDFTTSSKYVDFDFKVQSSAIKILTPRSGVNLRFIYELMQVLDFQLGNHKRYWISEYGHRTVQVPEKPEQDAIASVLADADTEVNLLRQRLAKARDVKQGMAQELLTGRTRLTVRESVA